MNGKVLLLFVVACASPPATHTVQPAASSSSSATSEAHWPRAHSNDEDTKNTVRALHAVAEAWRTEHPGECLTVQRLKDEHEIAQSSSVNDAWGTPFKIVCDDEETRIISFGPDRREGTPDDIVAP
jgi:hypothetical protein